MSKHLPAERGVLCSCADLVSTEYATAAANCSPLLPPRRPLPDKGLKQVPLRLALLSQLIFKTGGPVVKDLEGGSCGAAVGGCAVLAGQGSGRHLTPST